MSASPTGPAKQARIDNRLRWTLLLLILLSFLHVAVLLDMKGLWWDESLSLQRAEQSVNDVVRGVLWIEDGITATETIDQHPFFFFLLQSFLVHGAGTEEYVVRFVSVLAATLLTASIWTLARWFVRRGLAPPATPVIAAALAAINPFMLWFGQEARPYAVWAVLAMLTTYFLLRATEGERLEWGATVCFVILEPMFLATHYFSILLVPFQALVFLVWAVRRREYWAIGLGTILVGVGALIGLYAMWVLVSQGGGGNFSRISLAILLPDLVNAFSLGLSVDYGEVWWIDAGFAALVILGMVWGLRSRRAIAAGGWVLPAFFVVSLTLLLIINNVQPLYMTARHLSQLVGGFILLLAIGLGVVWQWQRIVAGLIMLAMLAAIGYSTVNYFTAEPYQKDDFPRLGDYMDGRIMPGDVVLYYQPNSWRIFEYYLPMAPVHAASAAGAPVAVYGAPLLDRSMDETKAWLQELGNRYQRIWLLKYGVSTAYDPEGEVEKWLMDHFVIVRNAGFFSNSSLRAQLYLPEAPVYVGTTPPIDNPVRIEFGDQVTLVGYEFDPPVAADLPAQTRLYWQVDSKPARRLKYILSLVEEHPDGSQVVITSLEREPYEGDIPTTVWDPGRTIKEYVELPPRQPLTPGGNLFVTMQMYDGETLEKLPVTAAAGGEVMADGVTVRLPFAETR